jgi:hypothetical protein
MPGSLKVIGAFVSGLVLSVSGGVYYVMFAQRGSEPLVKVQQEVQSPKKAQPKIDAASAIIGIPEAMLATNSLPAKNSRAEILPPKPKATRSRPPDRTHTLAMLRPPAPQRPSAPIEQASPPGVSAQLHTVTIPIGTNIAVRLIEPLSTDCKYIGDTFSGALDLPIIISGVSIAARGAKVSGMIIKERAGGRLGAAVELHLTLTRIATTEGQSFSIATNQYLRVTSCAIPGNILGVASDSRRPGGGNEESVLTGVRAVRVESSTTAHENRLIFTVISPVTVNEEWRGN